MCVVPHGELQVAIKVLRGGSSSRANFREQLIKVCFLIRRAMQTASASMPGASSARHFLAEAVPLSRCQVLWICLQLRYEVPGLVLEIYEGKNVMAYTKRESFEETKLRLVHNPFISDSSRSES